MKKIILCLVLTCFAFGASWAQSSAFGVRVGYKAMELSVQCPTADNTRLESDLGVGGKFWSTATNAAWGELTESFQWVFGLGEKWNLFIGPAAGVGYGIGKAYTTAKASRFRLNFGGIGGIEYLVSPHFAISLDYRPMVNVFGVDNVANDFVSYYAGGLGLRYRF
jgi:hypothetical protein